MTPSGLLREGGLSAKGSRVVLVGTGSHAPQSTLPEVPSASTTVRDLAHELLKRCGLAEANLRVLVDPKEPATIARVLTEAADQCEEVLLVYYVGHGLIGPNGELHLATRATEDLFHGTAAYQALPFSALRDAVASSRAQCVIVVLDCCFSGRAPGWAGSAAGSPFELSNVHGGYLLASAERLGAALAPTGQRHTAFTGELIRLLRAGDPAGPPVLTLDHVYRHLVRVLPGMGIPQPRRQSSDRAGDLVLAPNPAYRPPDPSQRSGRTTPQSDSGRDQESPYRGLQAFGPADAAYFHGRARLTDDLVRHLGERLDRPGPLMVVGPSGSGKSSVLRAGLLPALARDALPGSAGWPVLALTPGARPLASLADKLATAAGTDPGRLLAELGSNPARAASACLQVLQHQAGGSRLVLLVDQFEEVFTRCAGERDRQQFVDSLCRAATLESGNATQATLVVVGLRADFYGHCAAYTDLVTALQDGQTVVGPMNRDELRDAIVKPAEAAGLALETGLVDRLLHDLGTGTASSGAAGRLPLLAHALLTTWQHREGRLLTLAGYQATGGIHHALARTAESVFTSLDQAGQQACRRLLLRMVVVGRGTEDVRRPARLDEIYHEPFASEPAATGTVLELLGEQRLVTSDEDTIEVTHEALLVHWPRLRGWIDADRAGLLVRQRLSDTAREWDETRREPSALYAGAQLVAAREWAADERHAFDLTPSERAFLEASERRERSRRRRIRQIVAALTALLLLATSASVIAYVQRGEALHERQIAVARGLVDAARSSVEDRPDIAMLLAVEAMRTSPDLESRSLALDVLQQTPDIKAVVQTAFDESALRNIVAAPDGHTLMLAGEEGLLLWDVTKRRLTQAPVSIHVGPVGRVVSVMANSRVAVAHQDRIQVLDLSSGRSSAFTVASPNDAIWAIEAHPSRQLIAWGARSGAIGISDVAGRHRQQVLQRSGPQVLRVRFSPDGRTLATGDASGAITLWDVDAGTKRSVLQPYPDSSSVIQEMAFLPGSDQILATLSRGSGRIRFWDADSGRSLGGLMEGDQEVDTGFSTFTFSSDGRRMAAANVDGGIELWNAVTRSERVGQPLTHEGQRPIALGFTADSQALAMAGSDGLVILWDLSKRQPPVPVHGVGPGWLSTSADGSRMVAVGRNGTWTWDLTKQPPTATQLGLRASGQSHIVALSADGALLAVAGWDSAKGSTVEIHNVRSGKALGPPFEVAGPSSAVMDMAFSWDAGTLITAAADQTIRFWDVKTRTSLGPPRAVADSAALSPLPDGTLLVGEKRTTVWDIRRQRPLGPPSWPGQHHKTVADREGSVLAVPSSNDDGAIIFWDIQHGRELARTPKTDDSVDALAFSPDGDVIVATDSNPRSQQGKVRFWDVRSGRQLGGTISTSLPRALAMTPDGKRLILYTAGGALTTIDSVQWSADTDALGTRLCQVAGRNLTTKEWSRFLPDDEYRSTCQQWPIPSSP
jgi:WD40 repeat protein